MIKYFKMKRNELKVKAVLYEIIAVLLSNQEEIFTLVRKLYVALKDVPTEELKSEFIKQLAEIVHEENKDESE